MVEYIDREALIAEFKRLELGENSFIERVFADGVYAIIEQFHAADVAPVVHGRWVQCFEDWRKQIEGDKCSACGFEHYGTSIDHYHYCPNCGAKMDGEAEELPHE